MRWLNRLSSRVPSAVRSRGSQYFSQGNVHIESGSANHVDASVYGSMTYTVRIRIEDRKVVTTCDCPYFDGEGTCKHIWATLLSAEEGGYLYRIASMWMPVIVSENESEGDSDIDDGDDNDEFGEFDFVSDAGSQPVRAIPRVRNRGRAPQPKPPKIPEWKQQLLDLRRHGTTAGVAVSAEDAQRIIYVLDVSECLQHGGLIIHAAASRRKNNGDWGKPGF